MLKLNKDVLLLILEELQNDGKSLHSCLLVNRTLCEITVPILWKDPLKYCLAKRILFNVIILHLSKESRENLENQEIYLFTETYRRPLFNYINFWRYLNLFQLNIMIIDFVVPHIGDERYKLSIARDEIMDLFINKNTEFTSLCIISSHSNGIPDAEHCFSDLKFLHCDTFTSINNEILMALSRTSKSIEKMEIYITEQSNNESGIIKLIKAQKNLNDVQLFNCTSKYTEDESFRKNLEGLLIKHANTIKYLRLCWKPTTKLLSYLINLISLNIYSPCYNMRDLDWSYLENATLPVLKFLKVRWIPYKSLESLIGNTKGHLAEISIDYKHNNDDGKRLIQTIYQNCPNLKYFKFSFDYNDISEFENLLINCQCLSGLILNNKYYVNWDHILKILTKSSPTGLFKFKFSFEVYNAGLESLKLFFDSWKCRHPILLQTIQTVDLPYKMEGLIRKYKTEGIIKKYDHDVLGTEFEEFEWIQKK